VAAGPMGDAAMRWRGLPVLMGMLLAGSAACQPSVRLEPATVRGALAPEVDSVVVRPFEKAGSVALNEAELTQLTQNLREALGARERLQSFDAPPTLLPNTAVLAGRLERFAVTERKGDGLTLRTIELGAEVRVLPPEGDTPRAVIRRAVAWQRLYPGTVSGLPLDLGLAVRELSEQLAQALAPQVTEPGQRLWDGRDPRTGAGTSHAALLKGNQYAGAGFFEQAIQAWQRVLFDPSLRAGAMLYQVTPATLGQLRNAGLSEDVLGRLEPLLAEFHDRLRDHGRLESEVLYPMAVEAERKLYERYIGRAGKAAAAGGAVRAPAKTAA